jgi:hypothetical protein
MRRSSEATIAARLRFQADACEQIGSPLYAGLLGCAAGDVEARGPTWEVLLGHEDDPTMSALALRLMGAVNRLVLQGDEPALADIYRGSRHDASRAWPEFRAVLERNLETLRRLIELPVQTNEVGRCAALLPGFLTVAAETGLPLRLLEIGASAGLNLRWDHYRYSARGFAWGPVDSSLQIDFELEGEPPNQLAVDVADRAGCDAAAIDPSTEEGRLSLLAYVWPDQRDRVERLKAALDVAAQVPISIVRESATSWVERHLAARSPGLATVVYHSIVAQYMSESELTAFHRHLRDAGDQAAANTPLAWLRMEPAGEWADVHLTIWPGGENRHLARVGYHGTPVKLLQEIANG